MNFQLATAPTHPSHRVEDVRIHIHSICCDANAAGQQLAQLSKRGSNKGATNQPLSGLNKNRYTGEKHLANGVKWVSFTCGSEQPWLWGLDALILDSQQRGWMTILKENHFSCGPRYLDIDVIPQTCYGHSSSHGNSVPQAMGHLPKFYLNLLTLHHQTSSIYPGWWYTYPSEKWWSSSVGIFLPNWMEKQNSMVPNHQPVLNISNEQNIMFGYHKSPTDHSTDQSFKILSGPLLADRDSLLSIVRIPQIFIWHPLNSTNIMQSHLSIIYSPYIPYMPHIFPIYFLYSPYVPHILLHKKARFQSVSSLHLLRQLRRAGTEVLDSVFWWPFHQFNRGLMKLWWWDLVGGAITILKNMSSSMGRMTSHVSWKIKNVPNHQPGIFSWDNTWIR